MMRKTTGEEGKHADLLISPRVRNFSFLDSTKADDIIGRGREAILPHMDEIARLSDLGPRILDLNRTR